MIIKFEEMTDEDDESDKHLEARDRGYSCLKIRSWLNSYTLCHYTFSSEFTALSLDIYALHNKP